MRERLPPHPSAAAEDEPLVESRDAAESLAASITTTLLALGDVLTEESGRVRRGDLAGAAALTPEKARLSQDYMVAMVRAKRNGAALARLDPEGLQRLRGAHKDLMMIIEENLRRLASARDSAEELVRSAARSVGAIQAPQTYGRAGAAPQAPPMWRGLAVNRSL